MMIYVPIVLALIGLLFMAMKRAWVLKQDAGDGNLDSKKIWREKMNF